MDMNAWGRFIAGDGVVIVLVEMKSVVWTNESPELKTKRPP